jgi:hypothetical protein
MIAHLNRHYDVGSIVQIEQVQSSCRVGLVAGEGGDGWRIEDEFDVTVALRTVVSMYEG